ncbi:MAG: energy coupling factor transporter S component ThiW [Nitrososphaerota archaeon]
MKTEYKVSGLSRKVALTATFSALGIVLAPFFWFPFLGTRAYPGQHLINSLAGVMLGPWWAALVAIIIGLIRNALGVGTVFAFPGGIPGAIVVGLIYMLTSRIKSRHLKYVAALFEPIGTVFIGGTISLLLVAPWAAGYLKPAQDLLMRMQELGAFTALLTLWSGWAISSVIGSTIGFVILIALERFGVLSERS